MLNSFYAFTKIVLILSAVVCLSAQANSQNKMPVEKTGKGGNAVTKVAKGTFEVKVTPLPAEENVGDSTISRLSLEKTWSGDLAGISKGQMLGSQSETEKGSGGYVAMEHITGTLQGKKR